MDSLGLFNQTFSLLEKSTDLRPQKHSLPVSNNANMDTPDYKAFDILVEEEMGKALGEAKTTVTLNRTQPGYIPLSGREGGIYPMDPAQKLRIAPSDTSTIPDFEVPDQGICLSTAVSAFEKSLISQSMKIANGITVPKFRTIV